MTIPRKTGRPGAPVPAHSDEVVEVHERLLRSYSLRSQYVDVGSGRLHVVESGAGPPVILLHGTNTSALSFLPLLEHLDGLRVIAVDRPGFGLSAPSNVPRERFRGAAVEFLEELVDELALESFALAGNSMGGTWALWYALHRPERVRRLVLIGSAPLLPGTCAPAPLRLVTVPVVGDLLTRLLKPNAKMVVRLLSSVGEKDTIVRHPDVIEAVVAAGRDPVAARGNLAELRAAISPFGFRHSAMIRNDELRHLSVPTLLIWGDHDPVGGVEVAQAAAGLIPDAQLELLPAGHVPYLGHPDRTSELVSGFIRSGADGTLQT